MFWHSFLGGDGVSIAKTHTSWGDMSMRILKHRVLSQESRSFPREVIPFLGHVWILRVIYHLSGGPSVCFLLELAEYTVMRNVTVHRWHHSSLVNYPGRWSSEVRVEKWKGFPRLTTLWVLAGAIGSQWFFCIFLLNEDLFGSQNLQNHRVVDHGIFLAVVKIAKGFSQVNETLHQWSSKSPRGYHGCHLFSDELGNVLRKMDEFVDLKWDDSKGKAIVSQSIFKGYVSFFGGEYEYT